MYAYLEANIKCTWGGRQVRVGVGVYTHLKRDYNDADGRDRYIHMYIYTYIYTETWICIYIYIYIYLDIHRHMHIHICIYIHTYIFTYIGTHVAIDICIYTHIRAHETPTCTQCWYFRISTDRNDTDIKVADTHDADPNTLTCVQTNTPVVLSQPEIQSYISAQ